MRWRGGGASPGGVSPGRWRRPGRLPLGHHHGGARVEAGGEAYQKVWHGAGRDGSGCVAQVGPQQGGDLGQGQQAGSGQEAPVGGGGVGHGADVQVGDVAHVDGGDVHAGQQGESAAQQRVDQVGPEGELAAQGGTEDGDRVDGDQFHGAGGGEVPGGAFGGEFRLGVGGHRLTGVGVAPVVLGEDSARRVTVFDGGERRGQDGTPHAGPVGGPQHAERALPGRADDVVLVLGFGERHRRGHVQHVGAVGDRFGPAFVGEQVGGGELQRVGAGHLADLGGALQGAHRGPYPVAVLQQPDDAMRCDEPGAAGHQYPIPIHDG